jgi:hypothetical protein
VLQRTTLCHIVLKYSSVLGNHTEGVVRVSIQPRNSYEAQSFTSVRFSPLSSLIQLDIPMRLSRYFLPILKENPREAEIVSHRLMLRAGMIRQQGQGSSHHAAARQKRARQGLRRSSARSRTAPARSKS